MNHDKGADDMAHECFKSGFDKLFGVKPPMRKAAFTAGQERRLVKRYFPTSELRKEYDAADDAGRSLMLLEKTLEAMVEPKRAYERAVLTKIEADNREMRATLEKYKHLFDEHEHTFAENDKHLGQLKREIAEVKKRAEEAKLRAFRARPFALNPDDPRAQEIVGEALRRDPALLNKLKKSH